MEMKDPLYALLFHFFWYKPTKEDIEMAERLFPGRGENPPWEKIYRELIGYGVRPEALRLMPCYEVLKLLSNLRQAEKN